MSSPAADLTYGLTTGTKGQLRMMHLTEWLKMYHDKFSSELKAFGFDAESVYSMKDLEEDYNFFYDYAFVWASQHTIVRSNL